MAVIAELLENTYLLRGVAVALVAVFLSHFLRELADGLPQDVPAGRGPEIGGRVDEPLVVVLA